jgi:hypothetical protein
VNRDLLFEENPYKSFIEFCKRQIAGVTTFRGGSEDPKQPDALLVPAKLADANLVCSNMKEGDLHLPMFDIDMPAMLLRSSTRNHYHLYIDKPMTWENYEKLLDVLGEVGILEPGYVAASKRRKCTQLRTPWTKKQRKEGNE